MSFETLLNKQCTLEERTVSVNSSTGEKESSWTVLATNIPSRIHTRSANEMLSDKSEYSKSTHILYMKYRQIDPVENRIVINSTVYNITGVNDMGSKEKYLALYLELIR